MLSHKIYANATIFLSGPLFLHQVYGSKKAKTSYCKVTRVKFAQLPAIIVHIIKNCQTLQHHLMNHKFRQASESFVSWRRYEPPYCRKRQRQQRRRVSFSSPSCPHHDATPPNPTAISVPHIPTLSTTWYYSTKPHCDICTTHTNIVHYMVPLHQTPLRYL